MRSPATNGVLERLIPGFDVVLENARPGTMDARGFGQTRAREIHPALVWCALTGFGQDGPNADHSGHDLSFLAHSGLLGALSTDRAFQPGIQLATAFGAMAAVIGIQAALLRRASTGTGGFVDISISEAASWVLNGGINALSASPFTLGTSPDRRLYACSDGRHVAVACAEPRTWTALCEGLGLPDLADKLRRRDLAGETETAIAAAFLARPAAEWIAMLAPAGAAVTLVNHASQLLDDAHVRARGTIIEVGGTPVTRSPVRLSSDADEDTQSNASPPPKVGEHNCEIFTSAGFSPAEVEELERGF